MTGAAALVGTAEARQDDGRNAAQGVAWHLETAPDTVEVEETDEADQVRPLPFYRRAGAYLDAYVSVSNVYDSNIDHNEDYVQSYGFVPAMQVRFRSRPSSPVWTATYDVGRHSYTNTERWDRLSHKFRGAFVPAFDGAWRTETVAEVSFKGTSEDRDLSDQFQLEQNLEHRFTRDFRLHLYGTLRFKRFTDNPDANSFKPNVGMVFEQKLDGGRTWEMGARYEWKITEFARSNYRRWTFDLEYEIEATERDEIDLEITYRRKMYGERFVEIDDEDFLRRDFRWVFGAVWERALTANVGFLMRYKYERRDSKDPEKEYGAHLFDLALVYGL